MDNFRWILLAVGIFIIIVIYLISRKNKRDFYRDDDEPSEDLPQIKTTSWDDLDEGVGEVRIVARADDDINLHDDQHLDTATAVNRQKSTTEAAVDDRKQAVAGDVEEPATAPTPAQQEQPEAAARAPAPTDADQEAEAPPAEAVLVLNILARDGSVLSGEAINSVAQANDLSFGDMNIYHHIDDTNRPVFSLINMLKPGSFDPATIHELTTPGISLFLQLPGPANASEAFDVMLQTANRMSDALEARLCDQRRQPLTESVVDEYRKIAAAFDGKDA